MKKKVHIILEKPEIEKEVEQLIKDGCGVVTDFEVLDALMERKDIELTAERREMKNGHKKVIHFNFEQLKFARGENWEIR